MSTHTQEKLNLITLPSVESALAEFFLSQVVPLEEGGKEWGFSLYGDERVFIAQFVYADEAQARRGAGCVTAAIQGAVYIGPMRAGSLSPATEPAIDQRTSRIGAVVNVCINLH
jgi:hypothetical protein